MFVFQKTNKKENKRENIYRTKATVMEKYSQIHKQEKTPQYGYIEFSDKDS